MKMVTPRQAKVALRPCSVELGYLAIAWNQLHVNLLALFVLLLKTENEVSARAIWYAVDSDFLQRKLLRTIVDIEMKILPSATRRLMPKQAQEILWILDQIESLRHKRNNALHAPLMVVRGVHDDAVRDWVEAHLDPQHPRARPLRDKDLVQEFKDYSSQAEMLALYSLQIWLAFSFPERCPWPKRPLLPQAHKKKAMTQRA
jgi:hypothetical protein